MEPYHHLQTIIKTQKQGKTGQLRKGEHIQIQLKAPLHSFYSMAQLRKLYEESAHQSIGNSYELLKVSSLQAVGPKQPEKEMRRINM